MGGETIVSGRHALEALEPAQHAFDCVASAVKDWCEARLPPSAQPGRYVVQCLFGFGLTAAGIRVIAFVTVRTLALRQSLEEGQYGLAVGDMAAGQQKGDRTAAPFGQGVDLVLRPPRVADGLRILLPLPLDAPSRPRMRPARGLAVHPQWPA